MDIQSFLAVWLYIQCLPYTYIGTFPHFRYTVRNFPSHAHISLPCQFSGHSPKIRIQRADTQDSGVLTLDFCGLGVFAEALETVQAFAAKVNAIPDATSTSRTQQNIAGEAFLLAQRLSGYHVMRLTDRAVTKGGGPLLLCPLVGRQG
jgi:hypothetical protein